jgi:hypothetical protein
MKYHQLVLEMKNLNRSSNPALMSHLFFQQVIDALSSLAYSSLPPTSRVDPKDD